MGKVVPLTLGWNVDHVVDHEKVCVCVTHTACSLQNIKECVKKNRPRISN
jgi:hypothetical protein